MLSRLLLRTQAGHCAHRRTDARGFGSRSAGSREKKHPSIAVIIVSAPSESEYLLDAIRLKADGYLLKPLNLYEMLELLSSIATQKTMERELDHKNFLLSLLNSIGGKRVQIIEYIISHLDDDLMFHGTYDEVAEALSASKPTVVNAFQILMENNVLTRVKNGVYKMNTSIIGNNGH